MGCGGGVNRAIPDTGTADYRKEIDRLFDIEYGQRIDAGFRLGLLLLTGVTLYAYTGWPEALLWLAGLILAHAANFLFLRGRPETCTRRDVVLAGVLFSALVAAFVWMPARLMVAQDPALRIGGAAAMGAILVFLIHRSDRVLGVMLGELAVIGAALVWIVAETLGQVSHRGAQFGLVLSAAGLMGYFTLTMLAHRSIRLKAEQTARRSVQAQKMEAIGQLAGGVAHDFNNILTAVIGNLDLYDLFETQPERDAAVAEARVAALRAAALVRQLLAYARRSPMQIATHDLGALLDQVQMLTRRLLPSSIVQCFTPPEAPLRVALDQNQFITALVNLVVNARDAMPRGGTLTVSVRATELATPRPQPDGAALAVGAYAALSVADTGHGIPDELLRRVTEPFFTTKAVGQGSGLGLSMVEGFARQSGGALVIDSGPEGTVMTLLLPLAAPEPAPDPEAEPDPAPGTEPRPDRVGAAVNARPPGPAAATASPVPGRI